MLAKKPIVTAVALLSLFILANHLQGFQNNLDLKHISRDHGLPNITVKTILQDRKGQIWAGLESGGIAKFNGSEFILFTNDPANSDTLSSDYVNALFEDKEGNLWIGTENGLNLLTPFSDAFLRIQDTSETSKSVGEIIYDIHQDRTGQLWVATENGVSRMARPNGEFTRILESDSEIGSQCNSIFEDSNGTMWFATKSGAMLLNPETDTLESPRQIDFGNRNIRAREFFDIAEDDNGNLWFAHQTGLDFYDSSSNTYQRFPLSGPDQDPEETNVRVLLKDKRGYIWVGTFSDGLRIINPTTKKSFTYRSDPYNTDGITSNSIRALSEDNNGLVWIGTKFEGIFLYDKNVETFPLWTANLDDDFGMQGSFVLSLLDDEEGTLWIGTKSGGLNGYNHESKRFSSYQQQSDNPYALFDNRVEAIFKDSEGLLWLGSEKGLSSFNRKTRTFENFSTHIVRDILETQDGNLYVGTDFGLQIFDRTTKTFRKFPIHNDIDLSTDAAKEVKTLFLDSRGIIYIGTHHDGLFTYVPATNQITAYIPSSEQQTAISGEMIRAVFEDRRGDIWIGTRFKGLNKFDPHTGEFEHFTEQDGLPSNTIFGIVEDESGQLWLTTDSGLCHFNPNTKSGTSYTDSYGLQNKVFEPNAIYQNRSGEIFVGGVGGFNAFHPSNVSKSEYNSEIILSSVSVFDRELKAEEFEAESIVLAHDQNYVTFSFSLTDYSSSGQNEFSYRLEGLDEDWIYSGHRNYSTYAYLAPGNYRFVVRGKSANGEWKAEHASIALRIKPPFWKTPAFLALCITLGVLITAGTYAYLTKRQRWRRIELETTVEKRTSELKEANNTLKRQSQRIQNQKELLESHKDNLEEKVRQRTEDLEQQKRKAEESDRLKSSFLANMSHEIRTPMNSIIGFSSMICDSRTDDEERATYNEIIKSNCSSLLNLIDDILEISRIEAGEVRIEKRTFNLSETIDHISNVFSAQSQNIDTNKVKLNLTDTQNDQVVLVHTDPDRLKQILVNLVSNAIKFTKEGHITLKYEIDTVLEKIIFEVEDTGIGIEEKNLDVIWNRFRKIEDDDSQLFRGTGLGLSITKNLVELLDGEISVDSTPSVGTTFTFHLPYKPIVQPTLEPKVANDSNQPLVEKRNSNDSPLILVVEDENSNYLLLEKFLANESFRIKRAKDGEEAVSLFSQYKEDIELVLMDIKIPKLDGRAAAKEIRKIVKHTPIVAHTAYATEEEKSEIMSHGFDDYISKPVSKADLIQVLNTHISSTKLA